MIPSLMNSCLLVPPDLMDEIDTFRTRHFPGTPKYKVVSMLLEEGLKIAEKLGTMNFSGTSKSTAEQRQSHHSLDIVMTTDFRRRIINLANDQQTSSGVVLKGLLQMALLYGEAQKTRIPAEIAASTHPARKRGKKGGS